MAELGRHGHRQRMRNQFLADKMENVPDHNLLELYLSTVIPQKDVKPLSYDLINAFGSLEGVFSASPEDLMAISGVGEVTAVAISLCFEINKRIVKNRNVKGTSLASVVNAYQYCENLFYNEKNEVVYLVTINNNREVIAHYKIGSGNVNSTNVDTKKALSLINKDHASSVLLTHNHPDGSSEPSAFDIEFTVQFQFTLRSLSVSLYDHIIVGRDSCHSMRMNNNLKFDS